jgi:hypothetical protein
MNKTTLSNSTLKLLPIQTYVEMGEEVVDRRDYDTCAICLEQFVVDVSQVRKVPCGHIFHVACVGKYNLCVSVKRELEEVPKSQFTVHSIERSLAQGKKQLLSYL